MSKKLLVIVFVMLFAAPAFGEKLFINSVELHTTKKILRTTLPILNPKKSKKRFYPVYSIHFDEITPTQLLDLSGVFSATWGSKKYNVFVSGIFVLNKNRNDQPGTNGAIRLGSNGGPNLFRTIHHNLYNRHTFWQPDKYHYDVNITYMGHALTSSKRRRSKHRVSLRGASGELQVLVYE